MKLKRLISCGLVGILTGVGILMNAKVSSAEDKSVGVLTFPDENKNNNKVGAYTKTWNAKMNGREYTISNGNNNKWNEWKYIRFGSKNAASVGKISTSSYIEKISKVEMTIDKVVSNKDGTSSVHSIKLNVSDSSTTVETVNGTIAAGICEFVITNPSENFTYEIVIDCEKASSNGPVQISKLEFFTADTTVKYPVTFYDGEAELTDLACKVEENGKITKPADPVKEGYVFDAWYKEYTFDNKWDFENDIVAADTKLYAKFLPEAEVTKYTVTFKSDENTVINTVTVKEGNSVGEPENPVKDGYQFDGWYTDVNCTDKYDFNTVVSADLTLYAKWLAKYTVSFDTDGGSTVEPQTVVTGNKATKPTSTPTKKGYNFVGWYTDNTYTTEFDFENTIITDNTTIYAKFEDASIFKLDGYTFNKINTLEELTTGYYVIGGYNEKTNTNYYMGEISGGIFSADATYKNYYGIKAENGKLLIQDLNDNYINFVAEKKVELSKPKKTYFEPKMVDDEFQFVINDSFSFQFNPGSPRFTAYKLTSKLGNLVLYKAKGVTPINVTYKDLKGNELAKDQLLPKQKPSNLKGPALPGHKFVGWCKEGTDTIYDFNAEIQEDVVLVAKYEALTPAELFEQLEIKNQLAYHWQTEDGTTYTIDNVSLRFGVNLTEEMKSLEGVKFGAILAKKVDVANINLSEYARACASAAEVVAGDSNLKYLEFTNIAAEGGMTSLRLDNLDSVLAEEFVVVIYMEYNGKLYVTEQKIASVKVIASEYLKFDLEILKNEQIKGSLNQLSK